MDFINASAFNDDIIKSSGKFLVMDAMLSKLKSKGHKVLLFSTMTTILDVIEDYLSLRDYKYVRLDGISKLEERSININKFNTDPELFLFLISTKAGGTGLNLAAADTVIIYDSDWVCIVLYRIIQQIMRIRYSMKIILNLICVLYL